MSSDAEKFLARRIIETPLQTQPFPHFFIENAFPDDYYAQMRENLPPNECYVPISETGRVSPGAYRDRYIFSERHGNHDQLAPQTNAFWQDFRTWISGQSLFQVLLRKFAPGLRTRLHDKLGDVELQPDVLVVRDRTNYQIGPHTDSPTRLMSLLFYCPPDDSLEPYGTSLYVPRDPAFTGGRQTHHDFADFVNVRTLPFRRNSLFGFVRTDNSFHGVERIDANDIERDVILYNIRMFDRQAQSAS